MPKLERYNQFDGLHWETGTVRNFYDYCGVKAPHTGRPYSEALFLGVSGGAVMGYFSFAYEGYDPHVALLTRNTFDPFETMLQRLGVIQHNRQTTNPEKGKRNLLDTLEEGVPAIAWADMFSLPYNAGPFDEGVWAMMPILVYGYEEAAGRAWIADRDLYADFLDEASVLLNKPALQEVAQQFRASAAAWGELAQALLPDSVPAFQAMRELVLQRHRLFLERGRDALAEVQTLKGQLEEVKAAAIADFPLNDAEVVAFRENLRDYILKVHDVERAAVLALQAAMV